MRLLKNRDGSHLEIFSGYFSKETRLLTHFYRTYYIFQQKFVIAI